jgi:hypothetical protein
MLSTPDLAASEASTCPHQVAAGKPICGYAEMQHAAGNWPGFRDLDRMAKPRQVIRSRDADQLRMRCLSPVDAAAGAVICRTGPAFVLAFAGQGCRTQ